MRKILVSFIFVCGFFTHNASAYDDIFMFPRISEGVAGINRLIKERKIEYAVEIQRVPLEDEEEIVVVLVNSGSGLLVVDAYIYGCDSRKCYMVAMRGGSPSVLRPILRRDRAELVLQDEHGTILLVVPALVKTE